MNTEKWLAKWIWAEKTAGDNNVYVEARTTFHVKLPIASAVVRVSANQSYKLYINGKLVGRGPAPADLEWMSYDIYQAAVYLREGINAIALVAHNFGNEPIVTHQLQGPGGLICQLDLCEDDNSQSPVIKRITTDSDWKCRRSPRWKGDVSRLHLWGGYREIMDLAAEDGWERTDYDDSQWPSAVVVAEAEQPGSAWPRLFPREIPFLDETLVSPVGVVAAEAYFGVIRSPEGLASGGEEGKAQRPVEMDASTPGSYPQITYDFGKEVVGYPELEVYAEQGGVLQLYYGESLEMSLADTYLLRKGRNMLTPFGRRAFRFLKVAVMGTPAALQIERLQTRFVHYPFTERGSFRCSDEQLSRIWETGRYTTIVNSQNHFEDCPYREAALWVADSVVMAKVVYQTFDDPALIRKSLLQAARIQNPDGSIAGTGPQRNPFLLPDFCAHWLFGVWEYYMYTKDHVFLVEVWPYVEKLAAWFQDQEDATGLFAGADRDLWWCFIDWTDDIERKDRVTAVSCFYYKFLKIAGQMATALGETREASAFVKKAESLRESVRVQLRAPGTSIFVDCKTEDGISTSVTAQTNFAAAWSGIMEEEEAAAFIRDYYLKEKLPPIRGAFFQFIVLETMFRCGFAEQAITLIRNYWGDMLDRGATTWWETFDASLPFVTTPSPYLGHTPTYLQDSIPVSLSHGWGASPTYLLTREMVGIDMSMAGTDAVVLRPSPVPGVGWAEALVPSAYGDIEARWDRKDDDKLLFTANLPAGVPWRAEGLEHVSVRQGEGGITISGEIKEQLKGTPL
ncbi:family 78 glycoside hydrolase catalytic domain [Paenibacillus chibensis]|uniref:Family 78 glycoside hydrolase catalytic domain n=1 Tax=Paenibacillus chibensis TaxID=59846 RepID=A0ABU6Q111_9BACL|nr:family 78 glycoside hydrolase catalytic domain [Paenibacillus chibensis]